MYSIFLIALVILFIYFFITVNTKYNVSVKTYNAKEEAERELAASFIRNAIKQYEIRHTRPDVLLVSEFEKLTDEQDELVERYFSHISEKEESTESHTVIPLAIRR